MSRGHCRHHDWLSLDSFAADVALFLIGEPISGYYYRGIGSPEAAAAEQVTDALPVAFARRPLFARFARRAISSFLNDFKYHLEPAGPRARRWRTFEGEK